MKITQALRPTASTHSTVSVKRALKYSSKPPSPCSGLSATLAASNVSSSRPFTASVATFHAHRRQVQVNSRWLENNADIDVDIPIEDAFLLWDDRESIPKWMPWITSVVVQKDDPRMSRWTLSTYQFGQQWAFSWLALNMTPMKNQKIHWRSVPGSTAGSLGSLEVQNRGQIRFFKKSPTSCNVKLTISYEVPNALAPFANLLTPVVEGILQADMKRFAEFAKKKPERAA